MVFYCVCTWFRVLEGSATLSGGLALPLCLLLCPGNVCSACALANTHIITLHSVNREVSSPPFAPNYLGIDPLCSLPAQAIKKLACKMVSPLLATPFPPPQKTTRHLCPPISYLLVQCQEAAKKRRNSAAASLQKRLFPFL